MLYATKDAGASIGAILASLPENYKLEHLEIRLTQDDMVIHAGLAETSSKKVKKDKTVIGLSLNTKKSKKRKYRRRKAVHTGPAEVYEYGDTCLSAKDWAHKLGVAENTVRYRIRKYGNPYGTKGPTDRDKVIAGM